MEGQAVGAKAHIALLHSGFEQFFHFAELCLSGLAAHAALEAHHFHAEHRMRHKGGNIWSQRHVVKVVHIVAGVVPGDFLSDFTQYGFRDVLDPGKAVHDGFLLPGLLSAKAGAEATVTD